MDRRSLTTQWVQLLVLSGVHFIVDMFGNVVPAILPVIREEFSLRLATGGLVIASLSLASNGVQVLTGHLRADKSGPLFLHIGMVLAASICLMALAPHSTAGVFVLVAFGILSGCGIAIAHPEGLRAVDSLAGIPPALSTAVFMTCGFLGFASGGAISAVLVESYGLDGLYPLVFCVVAGVAAVVLSRVRLSIEHVPAGPADAAGRLPGSLPFWVLLCTGLPAAVATTVVLLLLPTYLYDRGFGLTFGGFSTAMFGWGGVVGPFVWAAIARRKGDLPSCVWAFLLAAPSMLLYFAFDGYRAAVWLLFSAGFCSMSAYILTITLARSATGPRLGQRMAFIVGGTWGIAMVVFLLLAPVADWIGAGPFLEITPAGYLLSGAFAVCLLRRYPQVARRHREMPVLELPGESHTPV